MAKAKTADEEIIDNDEQEIIDNTGTSTENPDVKPETGPTPEEVAADFKKQIEEANAKAAEAVKRAEEAEAAAAVASTTATSAAQSNIAAQEQAIEGKITTAKTTLESIKQQLKLATSTGDTDAAIELQDHMNSARYDLKAAEWEKNNFANWKKQQTEKPVKTETKSPYTAKELDWINKHPEFNTSKKFSRLAKTAAAEALDEGHTQDSRGYFDYIESVLKEEGLLNAEGDPVSGAARQTTASTAAAPNRSGGSAVVVNKNSKYPYIPNGFTIPKEWVATAQEIGFEDPREYANERLEIEANEKNR